MGIKYNEETKKYEVSYSKRHPITRKPVSLRRESIKTQAEAKRVEAELIVLVNEKLKKQIVPTWGAVLEMYFKHLENVDITNTTKYNREKLLRYHTMPIWENTCIDEITHGQIVEVLQTRLKENKESYKKCFIKYVRGVFDYAVERDFIIKNPTPKLKFKISNKIKAVLSQGSIESLLQKAQEQDWPWFPHYAVATFTGLRNGELYALKWENVDLEKRLILVNCSWNKYDGFKSTKTGHDRWVEIPMPLMPILRAQKLKSAGSDFVLPRLTRWDRGEQAHDLRMFLRANNLPEVNFHNLRASWATMLLNNGVDQAKVMVMGGWTDLKTMMIYVRKAGIDIRGATAMLDGIEIHGKKEAEIVKIHAL